MNPAVTIYKIIMARMNFPVDAQKVERSRSMKIKDLEKEIVKRLSCGDIEKVILFGSYAWGEQQ